MKKYYPEGALINTIENKNYLKTIHSLKEAMNLGKILEARAVICDSEHNLIVDLPCIKGIIPRAEGAVGIESGETRDIALIAKVSKPVCFKILDITKDENDIPVALLSRKIVECRMSKFCQKLY